MDFKHLARDAFQAAAVNLEKFTKVVFEGGQFVLKAAGDRFKATRDAQGRTVTQRLKGAGRTFDLARLSERAYRILCLRPELQLQPVRVQTRPGLTRGR